MKGIWQAATIFYLGMVSVHAAEAPKLFKWDPPRVAESVFKPNLGMLDSEREEYATNLAGLGVNIMVTAKASPESIVLARHMIALALQLSPRNKRALVSNFQLAKGMLPDAFVTDYSPSVFARLLLARGQLLAKQQGDENRLASRFFVQLAATLDPKNEDAIYVSEVQRLDFGELDWSVITDPPKKP